MSAVTDTIHTVVYDTVHTVSFDTVHVLMDSSITIQALKDSQTFYSNSFYWLIGAITVLVALFVLAMTLAWNRKFKTEVERLRNKVEEQTKDLSKKAFNESKSEFEHNVSDVRTRLGKASSKIDELLSKMVMNYLLQAKNAKDGNECLRSCIFAFDIISENFGKGMLTESELIVSVLEKWFINEFHGGVDSYLCKTIIERIEIFETCYFEYFADKSPEEKEESLKLIKRIDAIKVCLTPKKP